MGSVYGGEPSAEVLDQQIAELVAFARGDGRLRTWRDSEYRSLAAAFGPLTDVPLPAWQQQWVPGPAASWDAFARLLGFSPPLEVEAQ